MLTFGSIIKCDDGEYVYLATMGDIVYLAKILNDELSQSLIEVRERLERSGVRGSASAQKKLENEALLCFIVLTTAEFQDRAASFANPGRDQEFIKVMNNLAELNETDFSALKLEISDSRGVPRELKEFAAKL